jgi:hypothetical protein
MIKENWIPCNFSWTLRFLGSEYAMRLRGNGQYYLEEIESKEIVYNDDSKSIQEIFYKGKKTCH